MKIIKNILMSPHLINSGFNNANKIALCYLILFCIFAIKIFFNCQVCISSGNTWHAEGGRYYNDVHGLWDSWDFRNHLDSKIEKISLFLPFGPRGEKPVFIYFGAIVKQLLSLSFPSQLEKSLLWMNVTSILAITALIMKMQPRVALAGAFLSSVIILNTFDIWQLAVDGYHTILGLVFFLGGLKIYGVNIPSRQIFFSAIIWMLGIFTSPHIIIPIISIITVDLIFRLGSTSKIKVKMVGIIKILSSLAMGAGFVILVATISNFLQPNWDGRDPLSFIIFEAANAREWGSKPPFYYTFFLDYLYVQYGATLLLILVTGFIFSFIIPSKRLFVRMLPWSTVLGLFLMYSLKLPQIGRAYLPLLLMFVVSASMGLGSIVEHCKRYDKRLITSFLTIVIAILCVSNSSNLMDNKRESLILDPIVESTLTAYFNKQIIDSSEISQTPKKAIEQISGRLIRVNLRQKVGHHGYNNIDFETHVYEAKEIIKPIVSISSPWLKKRCFENEFQYAAFCKNDWNLAYPDSINIQQYLNPDRIYYFDGDKFVSYLLTLRIDEQNKWN
jgi:hypothetical protein